MSTTEQPLERDADLSMFEGFDVPSFLRDHNGIPNVATSGQDSVRDRLRAIQAKVIENDPVAQTILAGIVHERWEQKGWPQLRAELHDEFGNYDINDDD